MKILHFVKKAAVKPSAMKRVKAKGISLASSAGVKEPTHIVSGHRDRVLWKLDPSPIHPDGLCIVEVKTHPQEHYGFEPKAFTE